MKTTNKTLLLLHQSKDGKYTFKFKNKCITTNDDDTTTTKRINICNPINTCFNVLNDRINDMASAYIMHLLPRMIHTALKSIYDKQANPIVFELIKENARYAKDNREAQNEYNQFLRQNNGKNIDMFLSEYWRYKSALETLDKATQAYESLVYAEVIDIDIDFLADMAEKQDIINQLEEVYRYYKVIADSVYSEYVDWWYALLAVDDLSIVIDVLHDNLKSAIGLKTRIAKQERYAEEERTHIIKHHTYKIENGKRVEIIPYDTIEETAYGKLTIQCVSATMIDDIYQDCFEEILKLYNSGFINNFVDVWHYRYAVYNAVNSYIYRQRRYFFTQESIDTYTTEEEDGLTVHEYDRGYIDNRLNSITHTEILEGVKNLVLSQLDSRVNKNKIADVFDCIFVKRLTIVKTSELLSYSEQTINKSIQYIKNALSVVYSLPDSRLLIYEMLTDVIYREGVI